jgi:hypothetical protein
MTRMTASRRQQIDVDVTVYGERLWKLEPCTIIQIGLRHSFFFTPPILIHPHNTFTVAFPLNSLDDISLHWT